MVKELVLPNTSGLTGNSKVLNNTCCGTGNQTPVPLLIAQSERPVADTTPSFGHPS